MATRAHGEVCDPIMGSRSRFAVLYPPGRSTALAFGLWGSWIVRHYIGF